MRVSRQCPVLQFVLGYAAVCVRGVRRVLKFTAVELLLRVCVSRWSGERRAEVGGGWGGRVLKAEPSALLRVKCYPRYLTYETPEALRLREEKLTNSIFCIGQIYNMALLFGQFYFYCDI